ncbi:MAG TPA: crotonobetainyl-CoA--carnitine CoA-transferase [Flavobacteriales bacterium]|nr:crotonobetainyl-CoA--carnitine CoA-transferase [Flavobacteriales bacterium]
MEFGVRWGQNLVTFNNLRGLHEPFNHSRKIIGFDTFSGFPMVVEKDGSHESVHSGSFSVTENYEQYLQDLLDFHESECPLSHIKKNKIIKGDASIELKNYLADHPETIIAFAWFDFDIYEPTKKCLELIKPFVTKGTVIGFDELNDPGFPGETVALEEVFGLNNVRIQRNRFSGMQSYVIVE